MKKVRRRPMRVIGPREKIFKQKNREIQEANKKNEEYLKEYWYDHYSVYQHTGFINVMHPYNSTIFDNVVQYAHFIHHMNTFLEKKWIKLGYTDVDKLIEHYEAIIRHQTSWYEKQDKKTQKKFENYLSTYEYRLKDLYKMKEKEQED